jgi:DNA invertase Pin-like site-specific DNA recombinase
MLKLNKWWYNMKVALYARVSKDVDQNPENQFIRLRKWAETAEVNNQPIEVGGEFTDEISSRKTRPEKEKLMGMLRTGEIQGIAFVGLDRWARSVGEFAKEMQEAIDKNYFFISLRESLRFDSAFGRANAQLLMVFAELERELIRERTIDGLARAKAQGKILGRHFKNCQCPKHKVA